MMCYLQHALAFAPELLVLVYAISVLMGGVFYNDKEALLKGLIVQSGILFFLCLILLLEPFPLNHIGTIKSHLYNKDAFASALTLLVLVSIAPWFFLNGFQRMRADIVDFEYYALLAFSVLGMLVMVSANNLLTMYVGIELQTLPLYAMIGMRRTMSAASEAATKYFILGAIASGFLLYGAALVYGATNAINFSDIYHASLHEGVFENSLVLGLIFIVGSLLFKLSAAPFHMWSPDVYAGSSAVQVGVMALAPKISSLGLLARILYGPFSNLEHMWTMILMATIVISLAVGAFGALWQTNMRRLLAYSGIGHTGFMLIGFLGGLYNIVTVLLYVAAYIVTMIPLVWVLSQMAPRVCEAADLSDFKGLGHTHPLAGLVIVAALFSMVGIPPMAGFFGKLYVLMVAVNVGLIWLAVFAVLMSVISAFYCLRLVKEMYFYEEESSTFVNVKPCTCIIFLVLMLTFGWYQKMFELSFGRAVASLSILA